MEGAGRGEGSRGGTGGKGGGVGKGREFSRESKSNVTSTQHVSSGFEGEFTLENCVCCPSRGGIPIYPCYQGKLPNGFNLVYILWRSHSCRKKDRMVGMFSDRMHEVRAVWEDR